MKATADDGERDTRSEAIDEALRGLPGPVIENERAERIRVRAKLELRRRAGGAWGRRLARGWDVAEPWLVAATVVVFLGWTFERLAYVLLVG